VSDLLFSFQVLLRIWDCAQTKGAVYQAYRNAIPQSAFLQSKKRLRRQLANFSSGARLT